MSRIVILGAMPEEISAYNEKIDSGEWYDVSVAVTGVGKVAAAMATQKAICEQSPNFLFFTGVAGSLEYDLTIGVIVVCVNGIDSDLDARPWNGDLISVEQPFTGNRIYRSDKSLVDLAFDSGNDKLFRGYVASGSSFLKGEERYDFACDDVSELEDGGTIPNIYDMESSAVLQVANHNDIPVLVIRAVSDNLEGDAVKDFNEFIKGAVKDYVGVVDHLVKKLR